jgi:hypothetical protein
MRVQEHTVTLGCSDVQNARPVAQADQDSEFLQQDGPQLKDSRHETDQE